jgi:hypothetical protein
MDDMGLWVSPVVLVPGVGLLILSTSARSTSAFTALSEMWQLHLSAHPDQ